MTGFFRGPSLLSHLVFLGVVLGVGIPIVAQWLNSISQALGIGVVVALFYGIFATIWAVSRIRRAPPIDPAQSCGQDNDSHNL